ncbi:hypothetical protein HPP92_028522 [Vanilla planifolia]|uniref:Uncharacterized protein n=1 Tax=Vanilla planifolia TaxID=51239 RepID=A0A835P7S1_VANPL|nr:hypothetical protein HPP92_028522 [Vanilla planifolia]
MRVPLYFPYAGASPCSIARRRKYVVVDGDGFTQQKEEDAESVRRRECIGRGWMYSSCSLWWMEEFEGPLFRSQGSIIFLMQRPALFWSMELVSDLDGGDGNTDGWMSWNGRYSFWREVFGNLGMEVPVLAKKKKYASLTWKIQSCSWNERVASSLDVIEGQERSTLCTLCNLTPSADELGGISNRMWGAAEPELSGIIDSKFKWNSSANGKSRTLRRARTFTRENRKKSTANEMKDNEGLSENDMKNKGDLLVSESEKLGVNILGQRFGVNPENAAIIERELMDFEGQPVGEQSTGQTPLVSMNFETQKGEGVASCNPDLGNDNAKSLVVSSTLFEVLERVSGESKSDECELGDSVGSLVSSPSKTKILSSHDGRLNWDLNTGTNGWEGLPDEIFVSKLSDTTCLNKAGVHESENRNPVPSHCGAAFAIDKFGMAVKDKYDPSCDYMSEGAIDRET